MSSGHLSAIVTDRLAAHARASGVALVEKIRGRWRALDWRALEDEVSALAHGLAEAGVSEGQVVVLLSAPRARALLVALAVQTLGATPVAADPQRSDTVLAAVLASVGARVAFADDHVNGARLAAADGRAGLEVILHDDAGTGAVAGGGADPRLRAYGRLLADGRRRRGEGAPLFAGGSEHRPATLGGGLWRALAEAAPEADAEERLLFVEGLAAPSVPHLLARWLAGGGVLGVPEVDGDPARDRRELGPTAVVATGAWFDGLWNETDAGLPAPATAPRRFIEGVLGRGGQAGPLGRWVVRARLARALGLDGLRRAEIVGGAPGAGAQRLLAALGVAVAEAARSADRSGGASVSLAAVEARTAA